MTLNNEATALERAHDTRNDARDTQRLILSLGFDAKIYGRKVVAVIPEYELVVLGMLLGMNFSLIV